MSRWLLGLIVGATLVVIIMWYNRPDNGVYPIGKNAVIIKGSCITINWDASVEDAYMALTRWQQIKGDK